METIYVIVGKDIVDGLSNDEVYANQIRELERITRHEKPVFANGFLKCVPEGLEKRINGDSDVELRICGAYAHREVQIQQTALQVRGYNANAYEPACIRQI
ncbi:hypothetical protein HN385_05205 [archaeon]|jgi:hypothetical protein|nr:hypothetical protein [archaeon]MBT3451418.1 hypothetical protein [archaeon]MBT6869237.1 hypothetical protein [archaeon]MBT7193635.1 hypothetical protein [archaeon]MBT7380253.1 hypothetical protein [archaeon]